MVRGFAPLFLAALVACGDDGGIRDGGMDSTLGDAGDGGSDAIVDAGDSGPPPRGCSLDDDCESGICVDPVGELGLGTGYCTTECADDADCDALDGDGLDYGCVATDRGSRCHRVCSLGFGCPEGHVCMDVRTGDGNRADLCVDLSAHACGSDVECDPAAVCTFIASDREHLVQGCVLPLDSFGRPGTGLRAGEACNPRGDVYEQTHLLCESAADCPTGWGCEVTLAEDFSYDVCRPPPSERCLFTLAADIPSSDFHCRDPELCGCLDEGICGGLCEVDEDCGSQARCSLTTFHSLSQGTTWRFDDGQSTAGLCSYAAGSRTPCAREADCASSGPGGARETCKLGLDATGAVSPICVTPPPDLALPGEACDDDPATPEHDFRPCINRCVAGVCAGACMVDSDCGSGTCMDLFVDAEAVSGMCVSNVSTCGADADCGAGEVCRLIETAAGGATVCGPPLGELGPGEVCRKLFRQDALGPDQRCASLSCEKLSDVSVCPTLCSTDRDCPVEHHCAFGERTVNGRGTFDRTDDVVVTHGVCEHSPGGGTPCSANADCPDFEGCYDTTRADGTATRMCLLTYSTAAVGADCTVGTADICRAARTCLVDFTTLHEYCAAPCATDADCGETGLVCRTTRDDRRDVPRTLCVAADDPRFPT